MASIFGRISRFARSPQGKRLLGQAQRFARDPDTRRKLAQLRQRRSKQR